MSPSSWASDIFATPANYLRFIQSDSLQFWFGSRSFCINRSWGIAMRATPVAAAGVLAIMAVASANAADIVPPQVSKERPLRPLPPPVVPAYNWMGFYVG